MRITFVFVRCGQFADFCAFFTFHHLGSIEVNVSRSVILRRLWCRVVRIILHLQGKFFLECATTAIISRNRQFNRRFFGKIEMLTGFQLQRTVNNFKAAIAYRVGMRITLVFVRCGQLADFHTVFTFDNLGYIQGNIGRCMICLRNFLTAYPHCRAAFRMFDMSFFINVIHLHRNTFAIIFRFDRISFALANFFSGDIPSEFGGICHHTIAITDDSKEGFSHCRDTRFSIDVHCSRFIH